MTAFDPAKINSQKPADSGDAAAPLEPAANPARFDRRKLLVVGGSGLLGMVAGYPLVHRAFSRERSAPQPAVGVFIARNQRYDGPLVRTIRDGLIASGFDPKEMAGKRVLLKPNMVEPNRRVPHMTTHPAMIVATAEVFREWGAQVRVGEGPGHVRDTGMALTESGVQEVLDANQLDFADLNYEEVRWVPNRGKASKLEGFYFPRTVIEADLVVSMPKLKTHHWVGFSASLKNLYGVIPGIKYGWPKNVLHHAGIPQTVFDINASLPKAIAVIDGITCMEGDGPIMGTPKPLGLVIVGANPTAVDATVARIMGINLKADAVSYMQLAGQALGPVDERLIEQRGERWQDVASPFQVLDWPHLRDLRAKPGSLLSQYRPQPSQSMLALQAPRGARGAV